jgi:response regulator NasT
MRILVADDESIIRMGLKKMLQEMGHEVVTAVNGREAIRMAQSQQPDLAILDIKMPYTDGLQAAKTISRTNPLPILLLTAFSEQDLIEKATDLPIHGYLIKPITSAELSAAIAVAHKRFVESRTMLNRAEKLEITLEERKLINRAKGKLMATGMSEEGAYQALQQYARQQRRSMVDIARSLLKK